MRKFADPCRKLRNRIALAERLGIDLTEPRTADELDQLFLDQASNRHKIISLQSSSRKAFVADTTAILYRRREAGDDNAQITRWN